MPERVPSRAADLLTLTKSRITLMVVVTAAAGFLLASEAGRFDWPLLWWTLAGTAATAAGSSALNQVWERDPDGRMRRTERRPIPAGRLHPDGALAVGVVLVLLGLVVLLVKVNALTAALGAATVLGYVFAYTPLKKRTSLATVVGAAPGAVPPMMGWAAVRDDLGLGAWAFFGILFCW
ncbi:MAG TPA: UbiA family prenyltransferase, partial [Thermoanaerobaculia bacterium]|nr:UbiA family prenyltransferase [Thermoanaerobaculia bacterium]